MDKSEWRQEMKKWGGTKCVSSEGVFVGYTHSEPAAMSRYEVSAVSTPTGMTMLMTFSADQFLSYWVQRMGVQNTEACQPQQSLQTSKCIHKAWTCSRRGEEKVDEDRQNRKGTKKNQLVLCRNIIVSINWWSAQQRVIYFLPRTKNLQGCSIS